MTHIITPPDYSYREREAEPIIFLAGPIQSAQDWQRDATEIIHASRPDIWVANPRRQERMKGDFGWEKYVEQVDWEHEHLEHACQYGVVLFWLANESEHDCSRAYAQTTRWEAGEHMAYAKMSGVRLVIGIDDAFTGAKYVRYTCGVKTPDVPILESLEDTCRKAVTLL